MVNDDIISMPDKWEYPWYAAWDLAFHTLPLAIVDPDFAKEQINLAAALLHDGIESDDATDGEDERHRNAAADEGDCGGEKEMGESVHGSVLLVPGSLCLV